ncbi:universal stress protein [Halostella salina]|uniref:universal stress protein n=1 Tax=Halostella salina TaxID=1547897 RepID=UPI000EF7F431|nr:universal stress protein [Halostella salina]
MYDTILIPTDGSDHAAATAGHAQALARRFNATVHVISAVDLVTAGGMFNAGGVDSEFVDRLEADAAETVESVEALVTGETAVETAVVRGSPAEAILDYADDHDADLIAMGTHGRTGVDRYVAGSVTERVVRLADVPVLTAKPVEDDGGEGQYDDILVPTDGSDHAAAAAEHAVGIAQAMDARVHALNVVDFSRVAASPNLRPPAELTERLEAEGEKATEAVAERAREAGVDAVTAVVEGSPSRDVLAYAEDHGIDLIAMGTAGRTGLKRVLLGSTAERTLRHAEVPVLTVTHGDE